MNNQLISNYYSAQHSLKQTSNHFKISIYMVKKALRETGTPIRSRKEQNIITNMNRTMKVNEDYFDLLNAENVYYLGFLAADGCVHPNRNEIKIGLSSIDEDWMITFKQDLGIERDIKKYLTTKGFEVVEICFSSAKIKEALAKYDIVPNKTFKEISIKNIPDNLKIHYIRGFFDGDGSFSWNKNTRQGMVKIVSHKENILKEIQSIMGGTIYHFKDRNLYSLEYSTLPSIDFLNKIYQNDSRCLVRKKLKYYEFLNFRIQI